MKRSSEYGLPIFVSSTQYNLVDLRAELGRFLRKRGYHPILSSEEGFHDQGPELQPWESCLRVLEKSALVILIVDGRYGAPLKWSNFTKEIGDDISPTHAEYRFARSINMRTLVFVRRGLLAQYEIFRVAKKAGTLEGFYRMLPPQVQRETFDLLSEIKTTEPIPWTREFDSVTDLKREISKKLVNEVAEVFLLKRGHIDALAKVFGRAISSLDDTGREQFLKMIPATRIIIENYDKIRLEIASLKSQLQSKGTELAHAQKQSSAEVDRLVAERLTIKAKLEETERAQAMTVRDAVASAVPNVVADVDEDWSLNRYYCDLCGAMGRPVNFCDRCKRTGCDSCWRCEEDGTGGACPACPLPKNAGPLAAAEAGP